MFCVNCGNEVNGAFCSNCGTPTGNNAPKEAVPSKATTGIKCPKCKGNNVSIQLMETGAKTSKKSNGLGGNAYNAARGIVALSTLGLSNLVIPKAKGKNNTKIITQKVAVCQNCGNSWVVK